MGGASDSERVIGVSEGEEERKMTNLMLMILTDLVVWVGYSCFYIYIEIEM